jgi:hypothetical protein
VLVREDHAYLPHQLCLNFLRNRRPRNLEDISRHSLNYQLLASFVYSRPDDVRLLVVGHREHEGVAEQLAHLGWLLAEKIGEALELGWKINRSCHFNHGAS